ncbi:exported hypothetical protein [Candidatus Zixiibacteriota bacterium]|nr:exported hypothetical protein [candidate division Zixibacteria bacterium]
MVKCLGYIAIVVLAISILSPQVYGDIEVNEVLSNEPGGQVSLEWVELYNNSDSAKYLSFYTVQFADTVFNFPGATLGAHDFMVVCRRLITSGGTAGFESVWGNNSGIWGDDASESYPIYQFIGMALNNDSGTVVLKYGGVTKSTFKWITTGADGVSWERFSPGSTAISNCIDPRSGTPGMINSITPGNSDLSFLSISAEPQLSGNTILYFTVADIGLSYESGKQLNLYYDLDRDGIVTNADLIEIIDLPAMNVNDTFNLITVLELEGTYPTILGLLPDDDRLANNVRSLTVPGRDFPPVVISEFLADPQAPLGTEWVELKNISDSMIDLRSWLLGDTLSLHPVSSGHYILDTNWYVVLVKDSLAFRSYYPDPSIPVLELSSWSLLNNDHDMIRLLDSYGYLADGYAYSSTFGDNYSWARGDNDDKNSRWGRSKEVGGTPGAANDVFYPPTAAAINVKTEPNPFSLSRDGIANITYTLPPGESFSMKVYDIDGRVIKTMADDLPTLEGTVTWDGNSDGGRPVKPGIYILYLEVFGREQYKQTIVVAP